MVRNDIGLHTLCKHSLMLNVKKCIRDKMALAADKNLLTKGNYSLMINKIRSAQMLRSSIQRIFGLCTIVLRIRDECAAVTRQKMFAITKKGMYIDLFFITDKSYRNAWRSAID